MSNVIASGISQSSSVKWDAIGVTAIRRLTLRECRGDEVGLELPTEHGYHPRRLHRLHPVEAIQGVNAQPG